MPSFYPLTVQSIIRETPQAVSIQLQIPEEFKEALKYREGQYLAMRAEVNGEEVRRNYSFSSSPQDSAPTITVKEVPGGRMSTYLNRELKEGDVLEIMKPMGRFYAPSYPKRGASYFLIGGGSGITPLMSIAKTVLQKEPLSQVFLLYGNTSVEETIFLDAWEALRAEYNNRLTVQYVMEKAPQNRPELVVWQGITDAATIHRFFNTYRPQHVDKEYFTCGPAPMMEAVEEILLGKRIPKKTIHLEYFTTSGKRKKSVKTTGNKAQLTAHLGKKKIEVAIPEGQTVLDALVQAGHDVPFSCRSGNCSTCLGRCLSGKVHMMANMILEEDELEQGLILTCQSLPQTEKIEVTYNL